MKKKIVECASLGIKTTEEAAAYLDLVLRDIPKDGAYRYRTIRKSVQAEETREDERTDVATITTADLDLENEVVLSEGIDLEAYRKSMIVLWNHDHNQPIGKCQWIKGVPNGIKAKTYYTPRPDDWGEEQWLPDYVWAMVKSGTVTGKSIGFQPVELREPTAEEKSLPQYAEAEVVITKSVLVEYSTVSVPANPQAVIEEVKSLDRSDLIAIVAQARRKAKRRPKVFTPLAQRLDEYAFDTKAIIARVLDEILNAGRAD